jgi:hypothetical protein
MEIRSTHDVVGVPRVSPQTRRDELLLVLLLIPPPLGLLLICLVLEV